MTRTMMTVAAAAIILAAAAIAVASPVLANPMIPREYHGKWCSTGRPFYSPESEIGNMGNDSLCGRHGTEWITITAHRYDSWEEFCNPIKIKIDEFRAHIITFKCRSWEGGYSEYTLTHRLARTPGSGSYGHLRKRLYIEDPKTGEFLAPKIHP